MTTSNLSFEDISAIAVDQAAEYLKQLLLETYPSLDLSDGRVIRTHVVNIAALLHAVNREDFDRLRRSFSPLEITADPELADDDIVDAVYANYHVTRYTGNKATGQLVIILSELATTAVSDTTVFTANGLDFVIDHVYIGVTSASAVVSDADRLIEARADGSYAFTVPVTAAEVGEQYRLKRGVRFTAAPAISGVIDIQAAADFEGGLNAETNAELVERVQTGIAPTVFSSRAQVASLLQATLPGLVAVSQVGFGDPEMLRDRNNIFNISQGGKVDIYAQTAGTPDEIKLTKECTYIGDNEWQCSIARDDAPGYYLVTAVVPEGETSFSGSLVITSEVRGYDLTAETDWVHTISNMQQAAYTRYQTAVLRFTDPETPPTTVIGAKVDYDVYVLRAPSIKTLHDLTITRASRPPASDYLIKAAVPAIAAVTLRIQQRSGTTAPDTTAIKQAVYSRVNALGFSLGRLPVSLIIDAAQGAMETGGTAIVTPVDLHAFIYPPDTAPLGSILLQDVNELVIPDLPARGVTQRTTVFYLPLSAIDVSVTYMPSIAV